MDGGDQPGMKIHRYTSEELRTIRKGLHLNQQEFWQRFGVTQSGGSRYESGRDVPDPVQILINIAFRPTPKGNALVEALRNKSRIEE